MRLLLHGCWSVSVQDWRWRKEIGLETEANPEVVPAVVDPESPTVVYWSGWPLFVPSRISRPIEAETPGYFVSLFSGAVILCRSYCRLFWYRSWSNLVSVGCAMLYKSASAKAGVSVPRIAAFGLRNGSSGADRGSLLYTKSFLPPLTPESCLVLRAVRSAFMSWQWCSFLCSVFSAEWSLCAATV